MKRFGLLFALLVGCAPSAHLYSLPDPDLPLTSRRVAVLASPDDDAEAKHARDLVRQELAARGWELVEQPDYLVLVAVQDGATRTDYVLPMPTSQTTVGSLGATPFRATSSGTRDVPYSAVSATRRVLLFLAPLAGVTDSASVRYAWRGAVTLERGQYERLGAEALGALLDRIGTRYAGEVALTPRAHSPR